MLTHSQPARGNGSREQHVVDGTFTGYCTYQPGRPLFPSDVTPLKKVRPVLIGGAFSNPLAGRTAMRFNLSIHEAENLLTAIWIALEKHGLASPEMKISTRGAELEIELLFKSRRDEDLVRAELPRAMAEKIFPRAMFRKFRGVSAMIALDPELCAATLGYLPG